MKIYEELVARGLIAQVTNEEEIGNMINEGRQPPCRPFYGSLSDEAPPDGR